MAGWQIGSGGKEEEPVPQGGAGINGWWNKTVVPWWQKTGYPATQNYWKGTKASINVQGQGIAYGPHIPGSEKIGVPAPPSYSQQAAAARNYAGVTPAPTPQTGQSYMDNWNAKQNAPTWTAWEQAYQTALTSQNAANAVTWAQREDELANKYSQVREAGIKVDFSKLGRAVDQRLADELYSAGYLSNVVSQRDIDNARAAATQYANLNRSGLGADEKLVKQNYEFISRQLGLAKQRTEEGRGESRQTFETNVRGIKGAGTEAGALFSSAVEDSMSDQQKTLARMLRLADNTDAESQLAYDKEFANLQRKEIDIADQRRKVDLDLWNKNLELNSATDQLTIKKRAAEAQKLADDQQRLIAAQQEQALLRNFFEEVKRQQDAENWKKLADFAAGQQAAQAWANTQVGVPEGPKPPSTLLPTRNSGRSAGRAANARRARR